MIIPELRVLALTERHVGSGNEIGENVENSNDSFEELNIDLTSLEGTQKFISPNITVMSDLLY